MLSPMGGLFNTLPPLCIDLIADELVDLSNCNLVSCYEAEGTSAIENAHSRTCSSTSAPSP